MPAHIDIDIEALRAHRAPRTARISSMAERHKRIKGVVVLHDRIDAIMDQLDHILASSGGSAEQTFLTLSAPTRAGKTTAIKLFCALNQPVQIPDVGRKCPVLYVPVPAKTGILDIAAAMLTALGDPGPTQGTLGERMSRIRLYVAVQDVRAVIFDELQHLVSRDNDEVNHASADWIKSLVNELGVGFVLSGTERVVRIFAVNDQLPGRMADPTFEVAPWQLDDPTDFESARLYYAKWDVQLLEVGGFDDVSGLSDDDMVARLILASQGWPGLGAKLIHFASKVAIEQGAPALRLDQFQAVFERLKLFMRRAGRNPFAPGKLPTAREIWMDDETFSAMLDRVDEERRRKLKDARRATLAAGAAA